MGKRVRLTQRTRKGADSSVPYPGNVNQPDRTDPAWDEYHTFEQQVNHELPDMRHEWKDDQRDDIGFGVPESVKNPGAAPIGEAKGAPAPTMASVRVAANKAVKLAVLLLGEKVPEKVIEQQARDFLHLGSEAMDRTLARFANTQKFYADDDDDDVTGSKALAEKGSEVPPAIQTPANPQEADKAAAAKKAEEAPKAEEKKVEAAAAPKKAEETPVPVPVEEEKEAKSKKAEEAAPVAPPAPVEEKKEAAKKTSATDMDVELQGADDEIAPDPEADAKLASLFKADEVPAEDEETEPVEAKAKTAKKAGVTRLGGQPKVAAEGGETVELSSLWASAPDVNELFK